jgi:hypothetical protein
MGTWGHGIFENDDALDWVIELESAGQAAIDGALTAVTEEAEDYMDACDCTRALAAAEVVAALRGRPATDLPDAVQVWASGRPAPGDQLVAKAMDAINRILAGSELKDLWEGSDGYRVWQANVADLQSRLV